ncbi:MAG: flotillin-like FloA family protein [Planctomycetota bacterium]|jgi:uncharacterized protein YqfA (UPF0365 family)
MKQFILNPPTWMLVILWLSLAYALLRLILKLRIVRKLFAASMIVKTFDLPVRFANILGMCLRKVDPVKILLSLAMAKKAGIETSVVELESHFLAGGNPAAVIGALRLAKEHNMQIEFKEAGAIDLSGKDVVVEIQKALGISPRSVQELLKDKIK